jgi:Leucine-rich repeat (LRR) protein
VSNARSLQLICSDLYLYESVVRPDQFGRLPHLTSLSLEFCKIRQLPSSSFSGLRGLRSLSLRGHNSEWGASSLTLQLAGDSFKGLEMLETLDLSDNNIWGLPTGSLCSTPLLQSLNLSRNNIVEVSEVGLTDVAAADGSQRGRSGEECQLLHLTSLDLSYNKISSLLPRDLSLAPGLQRLNLRGNRLSVLSDQSLTGLWSLAVLDLADNQLAALPATGLFHAAANLQELSLQNNSLASLGPDTLSGLDSLLLLNLSRNALTSAQLSERSLRHLPKLVALDLSHNRLTRLGGDMLAQQHGLQILNLQHNAIASIEAMSFTSLVNLHILLLSHNQLESLPEDCFTSLASLNSLSLDHNQLIDLPAGQLAGTPALVDLALNNNQLLAVPPDVGRLLRLRTLDLGENAIELLADRQLENLTSLYGLRLAGNRIETITAEVFANATNLHVLNLAHNRLTAIDQAAFKNLKNLRALRLDNNQLKDINGLVSSQKNLRWLNVSTNSLQWFDFAFIPKSLEWLDIHNNKVDRIGNYYGLSAGFSLTTFDASFNQIREIESESLLASLRNIYLNNNRIGRIASNSFRPLANLTRVELQGNDIASLEMSALAIYSSSSGKKKTTL